MITTKDFCKKEYGMSLYKISFDAGFTCPNRDGLLGDRGCIFCSAQGSGDFSVKLYNSSNAEIENQIAAAKDKVKNKYKGDKFIAYFQAFTNTYAGVNVLRELYLPIINRDDIAVLSIATRPDCLNDDIYELLKELNSIKPVWVELGLQTTRMRSVNYIRRGYKTSVYDDAIKKLNKIGIHTITHMILYLPDETEEDMLKTLEHIIKVGSKGVKLQLLHVLKGTDLASEYTKKPFYIPTLEEYANTVKKCVDMCGDTIVLHRITGDPPKRLLIEPQFAANKKNVLNTINDKINPPSPYYVYIIECEDGSYYTGSSDDVIKRFNNHTNGKGAKYTKSHRPVKLVYVEKCRSKRAALSREYAIKQLKRVDKENLLESSTNIISSLNTI